MRVTKDECQGCPYKIRHEPLVVICHPCIRAVMAERDGKAKKRQIERREVSRNE